MPTHLPGTPAAAQEALLKLHQVQKERTGEVVQGVGGRQVWEEAPLLRGAGQSHEHGRVLTGNSAAPDGPQEQRRQHPLLYVGGPGRSPRSLPSPQPHTPAGLSRTPLPAPRLPAPSRLRVPVQLGTRKASPAGCVSSRGAERKCVPVTVHTHCCVVGRRRGKAWGDLGSSECCRQNPIACRH